MKMGQCFEHLFLLQKTGFVLHVRLWKLLLYHYNHAFMLKMSKCVESSEYSSKVKTGEIAITVSLMI